MPKITKRVIDALRPAQDGTELLVCENELRGFQVRVMPSGVASCFVFYRTKENRQRKLVVGRVGTVTPEEALALPLAWVDGGPLHPLRWRQGHPRPGGRETGGAASPLQGSPGRLGRRDAADGLQMCPPLPCAATGIW